MAAFGLGFVEELDDLGDVSGLGRDFGDEPLDLGQRTDGDFLDLGGVLGIAVLHGREGILDIRSGKDQRRADIEPGRHQIEAGAMSVRHWRRFLCGGSKRWQSTSRRRPWSLR